MLSHSQSTRMGGSSSVPEDQIVEIYQANENGMNQATISVDMRSENTSKLMDSFLHLHENTLVRVMIGVVMFVITALIFYGFVKCWCHKLHQVCGEAEIIDNEMDDMDKGEEGRVNTWVVFKREA